MTEKKLSHSPTKLSVLKDGLPLQFGRRRRSFLSTEQRGSAEICGIANRLAGTIEAHDGRVRRWRGSISYDCVRRVKFPAGAKVILCIRPENVFAEPRPLLMREILQSVDRADYQHIVPGIAHYRITSTAAFSGWLRSMERRVFLEAGHREDDMVTAVFSPSSVHVVEDDATVTEGQPDLSDVEEAINEGFALLEIAPLRI